MCTICRWLLLYKDKYFSPPSSLSLGIHVMKFRPGTYFIFLDDTRFLILNCPFCSLAAFYIISILVGGFSAIFAYLLTLLGGRYGIAGWAWIFVSFMFSLNIHDTHWQSTPIVYTRSLRVLSQLGLE